MASAINKKGYKYKKGSSERFERGSSSNNNYKKTNMFSTLSSLTTAFCSLFSYDALSYSVPQIPQDSLNSSASFFPPLLLLIILISGYGLIALQMKGAVLRNTPTYFATTTVKAAIEDVHVKSIDGHNLNQKGKPPEDSKLYTSARVIQAQCKSHILDNNTPLSEYQKARRRAYSHLEADDPRCFSLKDVAIEHNFNQILLRKSLNGSIKELPAVQPRSPLAIEQCRKIDLIKKAAIKQSRNLNFSLLKSFIKA